MKNFEVENKYLQSNYSINCHGRLLNLDAPIVMGIVNITPDSFFAASRVQAMDEVMLRIEQILNEGGTMIDVGAYSSRPGAVNIPAEEEGKRLWPVLTEIRKHWPDLIVSLDTFRASIARESVEKYGVSVINDISGGTLDADMFDVIAGLNVPYILMHMKGDPSNMQSKAHYADVTGEVLRSLSEKVDLLRAKGVSDIIIDPGFGFAKTIDHNFRLLNDLEQFKMFELPLLVGLSRKSMVYKFLGGGPEEALNGTSVLNTLALTKGANILRVHDVKEATECIKLVSKTMQFGDLQ